MRLVLAAALAVSFAAPAVASTPLTGTFGVDWFTVQPGSPAAGDFQTTCCGEYRPDMVLGALGPNGQPVYNPASVGPVIKGVSGTGEIQWWTAGVTAGGDTVTFTGSSTVLFPFTDSSLFPVNGEGSSNGGQNGFQTARFYATLNNPFDSNFLVSFNFNADDDVFLFVNGNYIGGLGGVHPATASGPFSFIAKPGDSQIDIFYADRHTVAASLDMRATVELLPGGVIPEPATWAMMIAGFGLVGVAARRRRMPATA